MIPPLLHFVWVGGAALPPEYNRNIEGWIALHPDWRILVWDDETRPLLQNEAQFLAARNPAQAADVLRYELMALYGGFYLDCDVEPVRALDPLRELDAFAVDQGDGLLCTAVLGSRPAHPAFMAILAALPRAFAEGANNLDQAGPNFQTPLLRAHGVTELPMETFYGCGLWDEPPRPPPPGAYGCHRWAKSWVPSEWTS